MVSSSRVSRSRWRAMYLAISAIVYGVMLSTFFGNSSIKMNRSHDQLSPAEAQTDCDTVAKRGITSPGGALSPLSGHYKRNSSQTCLIKAV